MSTNDEELTERKRLERLGVLDETSTATESPGGFAVGKAALESRSPDISNRRVAFKSPSLLQQNIFVNPTPNNFVTQESGLYTIHASLRMNYAYDQPGRLELALFSFSRGELSKAERLDAYNVQLSCTHELSNGETIYLEVFTDTETEITDIPSVSYAEVVKER